MQCQQAQIKLLTRQSAVPTIRCLSTAGCGPLVAVRIQRACVCVWGNYTHSFSVVVLFKNERKKSNFFFALLNYGNDFFMLFLFDLVTACLISVLYKRFVIWIISFFFSFCIFLFTPLIDLCQLICGKLEASVKFNINSLVVIFRLISFATVILIIKGD